MDIIMNASPLIFLCKINRLNVLEKMFDTIFIPHAVINEVNVCGKTKVALEDVPYKTLTVTNRIAVNSLLGRLHIGEVEVIIGAMESGINTVVLDDKYARNKAKQLGLTVTGTLGLLLSASKQGYIDSLFEDIEKLKSEGMFISDAIIAKIKETYKD